MAPMKRICIIASGTRGDVQPAIGLGRSLRAVDDTVRIGAEDGAEAAATIIDRVATGPAG